MRNLPIDAKRCKGADGKFNPTICPQRNECQRHVQLELDRQFRMPPDISSLIEVMSYPRVGSHACHFMIELA